MVGMMFMFRTVLKEDQTSRHGQKPKSAIKQGNAEASERCSFGRTHLHPDGPDSFCQDSTGRATRQE
jgi:hypothetical protein